MKLSPTIRKILASLMTTHFRYVLITVSFVIVLVGFTSLLRPEFDKVRTTGILAFQTENDRLNDRQQYLKRVQEMVEKYRTVVAQKNAKSAAILPSQPEVDRLFLIFQAVANASSMTLDSVAVTKGSSLATTADAASGSAARKGQSADAQTRSASSTSTLQVLNVTVGVSGLNSYEAFKNFLKNLELNQRLFDVSAVSYKPPTEQTGQTAQATTRLTFELKTYYLEPPSSGKT